MGRPSLPRPKGGLTVSDSRPVYIGRTSARMLDAEPPDVVGVLVKAILAWALRDELPQNLPAELRGRWAVIEDESVTMHGLRSERAEAGRRSGEARRNKSEQTANKREQTRTNANKSEQTETETEKEKEKDILRTESEDTRARAGKPASDADSDSDDIDFFSLRDEQLVPAALRLVRESGNARMRGRLVKARRVLGPDALRDLLATFAAEIRAGEVPANPGATLNARLTAREALA